MFSSGNLLFSFEAADEKYQRQIGCQSSNVAFKEQEWHADVSQNKNNFKSCLKKLSKNMVLHLKH